MLSWPSQDSRSGIIWGAFAAGWMLLGVPGSAAAQSPSDTRQLLLFDAVRQNNASQVRSIILAGVDVVRPDADGRTAVDIAVEKGHFAVARQLISARQLQQQIVAVNVAEARPAPRSSPVAANLARAQQVEVPNIQATLVAATRVQPAVPAPQIFTTPIDKLLDTASKLSRVAAQSPDRHEPSAQTSPKAIPRTPAALSNPDNSKITAPPPKPIVRQNPSKIVVPSQAGRHLRLGNDGSVQAIGDDAFKTVMTGAALEDKSTKEIFDSGPEPSLSIPFRPQMGRKPNSTVTAEAGASPRAALATVTNTKVKTVPLRSTSEVQLLASPGLERLRRRLKTMSRDQLNLNKTANKPLSERKTTGQITAARKSETLFLNRIFNSIADLLGLDGDEQEESQKRDPSDNAHSVFAGRKTKNANLVPPAPPEQRDTFHPAVVPEDAHLPNAYAPSSLHAAPKTTVGRPLRTRRRGTAGNSHDTAYRALGTPEKSEVSTAR